MVTAGPTYEPIDPVRFIGNHSSGKMGFAIAEELAEAGASVHLIAGPVHLDTHHPLISRINITTAEQMYNASMDIFAGCDGAVLSAAVADYRPDEVRLQKIKKDKDGNDLTLKLVKNKDILAALGTIKSKKQLLVGFSLETHNEINFALDKMRRKHCDMIVLNSLNDTGAGFSGNTNKITILTKEGENLNFDLKPKKQVAKDIVEIIISRYF